MRVVCHSGALRHVLRLARLGIVLLLCERSLWRLRIGARYRCASASAAKRLPVDTASVNIGRCVLGRAAGARCRDSAAGILCAWQPTRCERLAFGMFVACCLQLWQQRGRQPRAIPYPAQVQTVSLVCERRASFDQQLSWCSACQSFGHRRRRLPLPFWS